MLPEIWVFWGDLLLICFVETLPTVVWRWTRGVLGKPEHTRSSCWSVVKRGRINTFLLQLLFNSGIFWLYFLMQLPYLTTRTLGKRIPILKMKFYQLFDFKVWFNNVLRTSATVLITREIYNIFPSILRRMSEEGYIYLKFSLQVDVTVLNKLFQWKRSYNSTYLICLL